MWPKLQENLDEIRNKSLPDEPAKTPERDSKDMISEVLTLVRAPVAGQTSGRA